jgi:N-acetylmuramoyl-L-alanine amidase
VRHFILKILILFGVFALSAGQHALALDITSVRFGTHPDKTRMVIDLSNEINFRAFILPNIEDKPYRLVVDLPNFNWKAGNVSKSTKIPITDVRSGTLNTTTKRVVVDLKQAAKIKGAFVLPPSKTTPHRIVIDFVTITDKAFQSTERKILGNLKVVTDRSTTNLNGTIAKQTTTPKPKRKPSISTHITKPRINTPLRKQLIVIDAGHGGQDPGAIGAGRAYEKHVTLATAKALKKKLQSTGRYNVVLTRDTDKYLKLYQRRNIAHKKNADLFISLHADSISKSNVRGASIYTLSNKASDAQTARLAARENQVDLIAGVDLRHEDKDVANILIDLAMRDTMNQSKFFANTIVDQMGSHGIRILPKPHRYAGFAVLKSPDVPSVLVEMGFMSNKSEARLLGTPNYQNKIASALTKSIDTYFQKIRKNNTQ